MTTLRKQFLCLLILTALQQFIQEGAKAQLARTAQEVWPSIDVYYRMNPRWRFYATASGTKKESSYADGAIGVFADYFGIKPTNLLRKGHAEDLPGKFLWLRAGYQYSASPPSAADPFRENMFVTEANGRFYLPFDVLLTFKNRFDWRFSDQEFKGRYRPRLSFDKDLHTEFLFFTANALVEYYANFGNGAVNRFRTQMGFEFKVTRAVNYEVYWSHQFPNDPEIQVVDAFGMTLKVYMKSKQAKQK
jgi:hypothetical protein